MTEEQKIVAVEETLDGTREEYDSIREWARRTHAADSETELQETIARMKGPGFEARWQDAMKNGIFRYGTVEWFDACLDEVRALKKK